MEQNREPSREYYEDRIDKFDEFKKHGLPLHKDSF